MNNQQTFFAIGIPTINRADLLQESLEKMQHQFPNTAIYVIDNGNQSFDYDKFTKGNIFFIRSEQNLGVSASWNALLDKIYNGTPANYTKGCNYALILNDDIFLGRNEKQVMQFIIERDNLTLATTTGTWCAFILSQLVFERVGQFDEAIFPAYFEDNDYAYRLKLEGLSHSSHDFLNPEIYRNSQTIAKDPSLNNNFHTNREYYIKKWGGLPGHETFLFPFNQRESESNG